MTIRPFIGITGITQEEEMESLAHTWGNPDDKKHALQLGLAVANYDIPASPVRYVKDARALTSLSRSAAERELVAAIHYNPQTDETCIPDLLERLRGPYHDGACRVVQVNTYKPNRHVLGAVREKYPEMNIISQFGPNVLANCPRTIAGIVGGYRGEIDAVLLDVSRGQGKDMDVKKCADIVRAVRDIAPETGAVLAGGFSKDNVRERVGYFKDTFRDGEFSIDAEGKLRDADDKLRLSDSQEYLRRALESFSSSTVS